MFLQGLAPQSSVRRYDSAIATAFVSHSHRRGFEEGTYVEVRSIRRRIGNRIEDETNSDHVQSLEFSGLGSQCKVFQIYETISIEFHSIGRDVDTHSIVDLEARNDSKVCRHEALPKDSVPDDHQISVPWRLDLSMRGPESTELHQLLTQLSGNGLTQLIAMRHRSTSLQRSPLAVTIA